MKDIVIFFFKRNLKKMEIRKESLLKKLIDMKRVACDPDNYIYEFFSELRTQVDLETETKQIEAQGNEEKIANLHQINEQIISKINEFEKNYKNTRCDLEANKLKITNVLRFHEIRFCGFPNVFDLTFGARATTETIRCYEV